MKRYFLLLLITALTLAACSKDDSKDPVIQELDLCLNVDVSKECGSTTSTFSTDAPQIYASAKIVDGNEDDFITFSWRYVTSDIDIDDITVKLGDIGNGNVFQVAGSLSRPTNGWPTGTYEVRASLTNGISIVRTFNIQ